MKAFSSRYTPHGLSRIQKFGGCQICAKEGFLISEARFF